MMQPIPRVKKIEFDKGTSSIVVEITEDTDPAKIFECLNINPMPQAVITISGGADDFPEEAESATAELINAIMEQAFANRIMLVDGGTHTGIMKIIGKAFAGVRPTYSSFPPLIGFIPEFTVTYPGANNVPRDPYPAMLDYNHPFFVFVHGPKRWGGEVESMFNFVGYVSSQVPSLSIIANGGLTTLREAAYNVEHNRDIILLKGTKRAVEAISIAINGATETVLTEFLLDSKRSLIGMDDPDREIKLTFALNYLSIIREYSRISFFDLYDAPTKCVDHLLSLLSFS